MGEGSRGFRGSRIMKILIKIIEGLVKSQLPDDLKHFDNQTVVVYNGNRYFYATYNGIKSLVSDVPVEDYLNSLITSAVIPIVIDFVSNTQAGFDNSVNQYTILENETSLATGTGLQAIAGKKFRVPFVRTDTNRKNFMVAEVDALGYFSLALNFKTGGDWIINTQLLNSELTKAELSLFSFTIEDYSFKVI